MSQVRWQIIINGWSYSSTLWTLCDCLIWRLSVCRRWSRDWWCPWWRPRQGKSTLEPRSSSRRKGPYCGLLWFGTACLSKWPSLSFSPADALHTCAQVLQHTHRHPGLLLPVPLHHDGPQPLLHHPTSEGGGRETGVREACAEAPLHASLEPCAQNEFFTRTSHKWTPPQWIYMGNAHLICIQTFLRKEATVR